MPISCFSLSACMCNPVETTIICVKTPSVTCPCPPHWAHKVPHHPPCSLGIRVLRFLPCVSWTLQISRWLESHIASLVLPLDFSSNIFPDLCNSNSTHIGSNFQFHFSVYFLHVTVNYPKVCVCMCVDFRFVLSCLYPWMIIFVNYDLYDRSLPRLLGCAL